MAATGTQRTVLDRKREQIARELETAAAPDLAAELDDDIGDDLLRLPFTTCHPILPTEGRIALTLQLLGGLTTGEIARAFLVPETTLGQPITRAKRTLAEAGVSFEAPAADGVPAAAALTRNERELLLARTRAGGHAP